MMMRALKTFDYMGRRFKPGDVFEPAPDAVDGLRIAKLAADVEERPPPKKYKTRRMRAEDE